MPGFRQGLLENRLFLVCVWCVCMHIHTRSFNQSYELLQKCQSTADRALLHLSFWALSLLGSFITRVNCCETRFHLSSVFLLGLPFPQFFLVKKKKSCHGFVYLKKCPFHIPYLTESLCSGICQCVLSALIAHRFRSGFEMSFVFSTPMCVLELPLLHCRKNVLPLLFSPFGIWSRKLLLSNVSSRLSH